MYGTKKSFEWTLVEGQSHILHTAKKPESEIPAPVAVPDFAHLLPEPIRPFTRSIQDSEHLSFIQGAGHGGSHPHLVNEFVSALAAGTAIRGPTPCSRPIGPASGLCAHESAMAGGQIVRLPEFTLA